MRVGQPVMDPVLPVVAAANRLRVEAADKCASSAEFSVPGEEFGGAAADGGTTADFFAFGLPPGKNHSRARISARMSSGRRASLSFRHLRKNSRGSCSRRSSWLRIGRTFLKSRGEWETNGVAYGIRRGFRIGRVVDRLRNPTAESGTNRRGPRCLRNRHGNR